MEDKPKVDKDKEEIKYSNNIQDVKGAYFLTKFMLNLSDPWDFEKLVSRSECDPKVLKRTIYNMTTDVGFYTGKPLDEDGILTIYEGEDMSGIVQGFKKPRSHKKKTKGKPKDTKNILAGGDTQEILKQDAIIDKKKNDGTGDYKVEDDQENKSEDKEEQLVEDVKEDISDAESEESIVELPICPLERYFGEYDETGHEIISIKKLAKKANTTEVFIKSTLYHLALLSIQEEAQMPHSEKPTRDLKYLKNIVEQAKASSLAHSDII
ncbi:uncharacterized protein LOC110180543 [Drosophila serrata]|uniref:uncharacterized protein LOC110180543 n=1 Tax=Drosophila serrata TaxID=7274 RepID=UPI000A1CFE8C|nr:uncharacterized protein LOC110180543 [Drosophila serrata]